MPQQSNIPGQDTKKYLILLHLYQGNQYLDQHAVCLTIKDETQLARVINGFNGWPIRKRKFSRLKTFPSLQPGDPQIKLPKLDTAYRDNLTVHFRIVNAIPIIQPL